jgi:hypothetical protein
VAATYCCRDGVAGQVWLLLPFAAGVNVAQWV